MRNLSLLAALAFVASSLIGTPVAASTGRHQWASITDIGAGEGFAINDRGWVVGQHRHDGSPSRAFLWKPESGIRDLPTLGLNGDDTAVGINDHGLIVGKAGVGGSGLQEAVLWFDGNISVIPPLDAIGDTGQPEGINNLGVVVGGYNPEHIPPTHGHGFEWSQADGVVDLGPDTFARAINNRGLVVGDFAPDNGRGPFPVTWIGSVRTQLVLPSLPHAVGQTFAVNDKGEVVGEWACCVGNQAEGAALWPRRGGIQDLGTLHCVSARGWFADGINDRGVVVGTTNPCLPQSKATVYIDGRTVDLTSLLPPGSGWQLVTANAINDRGQVTGQGVLNNREVESYVLQLPKS